MWWILYSKIKANGGRRRKRDENRFGFFQQFPSYIEEFIFGNISYFEKKKFTYDKRLGFFI